MNTRHSVFGRGLFAASILIALTGGPGNAQGPDGRCSIARGETLKIGSWNIQNKSYETRVQDGAFDDLVAMTGKINADILALQGVSAAAEEVTHLLSEMKADGRCYGAVLSEVTGDERKAVIYDMNAVQILYPHEAPSECGDTGGNLLRDVPAMASETGRSSSVAQFSYFRARGPAAIQSDAFDFALINVKVKNEGDNLERFSVGIAALDSNYPWLADEVDRIIVGDLGLPATPGALRGNYFQDMKPLINPILIMTLGLSDMSFDEAVAGKVASPDSGSGTYDNILVRRWDRPGICDSALYCGGLEEFINANVYSHDKHLPGAGADFENTVSAHQPVSARFCRFADTDPMVTVTP